MRRNLGNPDAEKVLQDRSIAFLVPSRRGCCEPSERTFGRAAALRVQPIPTGNHAHGKGAPGSRR